jgi:uncharacterized protein (DUF952 family)
VNVREFRAIAVSKNFSVKGGLVILESNKGTLLPHLLKPLPVETSVGFISFSMSHQTTNLQEFYFETAVNVPILDFIKLVV